MPLRRSLRNKNKIQNTKNEAQKKKPIFHKKSDSLELVEDAQAQDVIQQDFAFVDNENIQQNRLYICEEDFENQQSNQTPELKQELKQKQDGLVNIYAEQRQEQNQLDQADIIVSQQIKLKDPLQNQKIEDEGLRQVVKIQQNIDQLITIQVSLKSLDHFGSQDQKINVIPSINNQQIQQENVLIIENEQNRVVQIINQQKQIEPHLQSINQQIESQSIQQREQQSPQIKLIPQGVIGFQQWFNFDELSEIIKIFKQKQVIFCSVITNKDANLYKILYEQVQTLRPDLVLNYFHKIYPV